MRPVASSVSTVALLCLAACAGPAIQLEPAPTSADQPLAFEVRDWDWNRSSFELTLRVTNHGDRVVMLERGFLALNDGDRSMAPTSRPQTCKIAPRGSRTVYLKYPAVDEQVSVLTVEFGAGALRFDDKEGEPLEVPPLRLLVGEPARPAR